jgi:Zn-dependent peptidase ImmA (M78 family)
MTQEDLAELAQVSQGSISAIEAGRVLEPAQRIIGSIADATSYPISFFYMGPLPDFPDGNFRRRQKGTSKVAKQVRAQVRQVVELVQRAEPRLTMPYVRLEPIHRSGLAIDELETIAGDVRAKLGLGSRDPIPNLMRAVERAGVIVVRLPTPMEDHDGFSAWPDFGLDGRPIIALSAGHTGDRDRFTVAHETGHLVLHTLRSEIDTTRAEAEAHRFAAALLIPQESAFEAMRPPITLRVLMAVKATFGTSIAMAAKRALDLNLISRDHYVSLQKQLSARGWKQVEPVEVGFENPLLIAKVLDLLSGQGSTLERAARVCMPVFAFQALTAASSPSGMRNPRGSFPAG